MSPVTNNYENKKSQIATRIQIFTNHFNKWQQKDRAIKRDNITDRSI